MTDQVPNLTILVVDDEIAVADTMAAILKRAGYEGIVAYSAQEALEILKRVRPALIISDVMMPLMNGVEFAAKACEIHPGMKIMLLSGHAGTQDIITTAPAISCLLHLAAKPLPPEELLIRVADLIYERDPGIGRKSQISCSGDQDRRDIPRKMPGATGDFRQPLKH